MPLPAAVMRLSAFIRLGRPLFLVGGFVLYALGAAVAAGGGSIIDWPSYFTGQVAVTATQLMTHFANDYYDLEADRANPTPTRWSGGSRVLPSGELPPRVALIASLVLLATALGAIAALAAAAPPAARLAAPLALAALALSWAYSAPPVRLCGRGLGELTTAVVVTGLVPAIAFTVQGGTARIGLLAAVLPLAVLQFAMLLAIEFPDARGDASAGKATLVVRLGGAAAARLYAAAVVLAYALLPGLWWAGLPGTAVAALGFTAPLALRQIAIVRRGAWREPARWETLAFGSVALLVLASVAELASFVLAVSSTGSSTPPGAGMAPGGR